MRYLACFLLAGAMAGCTTAPKVSEREVLVTCLKPEKAEYYRDLQAHPWPGVIKRIKACHIQNYSIFEWENEGKIYLFSYLEDTSKNGSAGWEKMNADPEMQRWWKELETCYQPPPEAVRLDVDWAPTYEVFHLNGAMAGCTTASAVPERHFLVTCLKLEKAEYDSHLQADPSPPGVIKRIKACHIQNYSIFGWGEPGGKVYLFNYFEYTGKNENADMEKMDADPEMERWWRELASCYQPLPDAAKLDIDWSDNTKEVFHLK